MSRRRIALTRVAACTRLRAGGARASRLSLLPRALDKIADFLLIAPIILFSMVAHEYAHGYAALREGDPTAYQLGRLTMNPLRHIDPFMTVILPLLTYFTWGFAFGGAKPVPVVPRNYRNFKRGDITVSLAGVATNFAIAIACTLLLIVAGVVGHRLPSTTEWLRLFQLMMINGIFFNFLLFIFNLLPIPPLDGSHVVKYLLPPAWALQYQRVGRYGLLLVLLVAYFAGSLWLRPVLGLFRFAMHWANPFLLGRLGGLT